MAPEETTRTSRLSLCSPAISVASEASHALFSPPAEESTNSEEPTFTTMRRKSLSDGVFGPDRAELCMAALCSTGLGASSWRFLRGILPVEGEAMRLVVYCAVAAITLGSVLLGLDWLSAPMSPMAAAEGGLRAVAPPRVAAPTKIGRASWREMRESSVGDV